MAQLVKNPPAMRETWVRSLGWEDPLEKGKATHSSILTWRIQGRKESDTTEQLSRFGASLVAQTVKRPPAMKETRVRFLGRENPLEKEMAIHSSTLAWKIPWTEDPDRLQSMGLQRVGHDRTTSLSLSLLGRERKIRESLGSL